MNRYHALKHSKKLLCYRAAEVGAFGTILMLGTQMLLILTEKKKEFSFGKTCRNQAVKLGHVSVIEALTTSSFWGIPFSFPNFFNHCCNDQHQCLWKKKKCYWLHCTSGTTLLWTYIDEENQTTYLQRIRVSAMTVTIKSVHQTYTYVPYCCHWWEPYLVYKRPTNNRSKKCTVEW